MPIWLRNFTYKKIVDHYQNEKDTYEKSNQKGATVIDRSGIVKDPSMMGKPPKSKRVTY